jgi:Flp pilus assembly protein TadG
MKAKLETAFVTAILLAAIWGTYSFGYAVGYKQAMTGAYQAALRAAQPPEEDDPHDDKILTDPKPSCPPASWDIWGSACVSPI